jgi:hypothetical protein
MRLREGACGQGDTWTRKAELKGGSMGEPDNWPGTYIFRSQVRLIGSQVRVVRYGHGYGCGPEPAPDAEHLNPGPDG